MSGSGASRVTNLSDDPEHATDIFAIKNFLILSFLYRRAWQKPLHVGIGPALETIISTLLKQFSNLWWVR